MFVPWSSQRILNGSQDDVVQITQFQSKDGSCTNASWEVLLGLEDCLATTTYFTKKDGQRAALIFTATCWSCKWLKWLGVKNAPLTR
eukprot:gene10707-biopygen4383